MFDADEDADAMVYRAGKAPSEIHPDAVLAEWEAIPALWLAGRPHVKKDPWGGPGDSSARAHLAWDDANLYLAVAVRDDLHHQVVTARDAGDMWKWDCLQLGFDMGDDAGDGSGYGYLEWTPGIVGGKDPRFFGTVLLTTLLPAAKEDTVALSLTTSDVYGEDDPHVVVHVFITSGTSHPGSTLTASVVFDGHAVESVSQHVDVTPGDPSRTLTFAVPGSTGEYRVEAALRSATGAHLAEAETGFIRLGRADLEEQLSRLQEANASFGRLLDEAAAQVDVRYPRVTHATAAVYGGLITEDIATGELLRAHRSLAYLEERVLAAVDETMELLENPALVQPVPAYDPTRPVDILHGELCQDGRPVIFAGVVNPSGLMGGFAGMNELGFNAVMSTMCPDDMNAMRFTLRSPESVDDYTRETETPDRHPFSRVRDMAESCRAEGLGLFLAQYPYRIPDWARSLYPELHTEDINHPYFLRLVEAYLTIALTNHLAIVPTDNLFYIAETREDGPRLNPSSHTATAFREWLTEKHGGDITRLNQAWGAAYNGFDEIEIDDVQPPQPEWFHRHRFHHWRYGDHIRRQREIMRRTNPLPKVGACFISGLAHRTPDQFERPIDLDENFGAVDFAAVDTDIQYPTPPEDPLPVDGIAGFAMWYDLAKSRYPDRPLIDPEWHLFNLMIPYALNHSQALMWQGFLHGISAGLIWKGYRGPDYSSLLYQPWLLEGAGRTALDGQRLAPVIEAFHRSPREVAVFYSVPSFHRPVHWESAVRLYRGVFFLDAPVTFVSERQIGEGACKLLVFPHQSAISTGALGQVQTFLDAGGTAVLIGDALTQYHDVLDTPPALRGDIERWGDDGEEAYLAGQFEGLYDRLGIARPIRVVDAAGNRARGIECRAASWGQEEVFYLLNLNRESTEIVVQRAGSPLQEPVRDLITGRPSSLPQGRVALDPLGFRLLARPKRSEPTALEHRNPSHSHPTDTSIAVQPTLLL